MIKISVAQEELENVRRAVLHEVNEGLDCLNDLNNMSLDFTHWEEISNIENNLRKILKIMNG